MTDSPRRDGSEPTQPLGGGYQGYPDPAYAGQAPPYGAVYQPPVPPNHTQQIPAYPPYGYDPYATGQYGGYYPPGESPEQPPPDGPRQPRWLWVLAGVAGVIVVALVIALVIVNSSRQQTVVAPLPSVPEPNYTTPTPSSPRTTAPTTPRTSARPAPPLVPIPRTTGPTESAAPAATDTVVYTVSGSGRAINLTYVDSGGVLQTEFNVKLPWSKQVDIAHPAEDSASISVINVGRDVTCTVSVNGVVVQKRSGAGLTICAARS